MHRGQSVTSRRDHVIVAALAAAVLASSSLLAQAPPSASVLDRIRAAGKIRLGYRTDARPFAYRDESGQATGYSVALCQSIADAVKQQPGLSGVSLEWVPLGADDRIAAIQQNRVDVLCGAESVTLTKRTQASFSIPIFPGGVGALVRADAPARLREVLAGKGQTFHPVWRASATQALQSRAFSAVRGTTADQWLTERIRDLQVIVDVSRVSGYDTGIQALLARRADAFFGERAILLDAARRSASAGDLVVIDRLFTYEPLALAFARGDDDFRLLVDRTLSRLARSGDMGGIYANWFGEPDENTLTFFRWNRLPE